MVAPALQWIDYRSMYARTKRLLDDLEVNINPRALVRELGVAQRQMVEVAKALSFQSRIMIMDEPTAALTDQEINELFKTIHTLQAHGVGIIYISHRLQEISQIGTRATVLRDGSLVDTVGLEEMAQKKSPVQAQAFLDKIITMMVGRNLEQKFPKVMVEKGQEALRIENLSQTGVLNNINLVAHRGEITGIAGLMGAGRTELAHAVFGITPITSGQVYVEGRPVHITSARDAIDHGIAYLPEDRKTQGVLLLMSVGDNIIMAGADHLSRGIFIDQSRKRQLVNDSVKTLRIRTPSINQQVQYLSGGNQQKVVLAKWLISQARIFIFDEPTRGVDVGAKVEVYQLMNELLKQGAAIIMISS
jgi:ribose transport system ATP-binding protein